MLVQGLPANILVRAAHCELLYLLKLVVKHHADTWSGVTGQIGEVRLSCEP